MTFMHALNSQMYITTIKHRMNTTKTLSEGEAESFVKWWMIFDFFLNTYEGY